MDRKDARVGLKVVFGRPNGQKTVGTIEKVNPAKAKVRIDEARGLYSEAGKVWIVPYSMMEPADANGYNNLLKKQHPAQQRNEELEDLQNSVAEAVALILEYGHISGDSRKQWVIDQVLRRLIKDQYAQVVQTIPNWETGTDPRPTKK